ncbi:hypothetical protein JCGZ_10426 [Jatropha curcas]|uniref:Pre-rRNA-processing protein RIX1 N-terminal domain-containing protein n=2 Tax=Jatropha curcas TaxID=180498 RepID=A0A067KU49_JATCU|nr:proline-, glutamic acid- and leucine-rich protein 1 isoform X1 [Jatropha curcas]KDP35790.1 hypothetical protein JCGZ_10426 [Jatropha curcas]
MAGLENLKDMYDVALKPRMLRTLLKEEVPDEKKQQLGNPSKLSRVVSTIQTFKLLSESFNNSTEPKLIERWRSAIDDWVNRLLLLVSNSTMPDKCWAGICLLGLTCQECSSDRFLASYAVWFDKLLLHIQSPTDSQFVKVASCTSMSDMITRLAEFPNAKKDGSSLAGKVIQPVLKLLQEGSSENVWEGAIHLLCTIITCFPASVHRHYDSVETAIASKILLGRCSINLLKKFACCLALLPKSRGDEDSWLSMMRKILLLVNGYLTEIFHGLEEESKWDEALRLLVPPGEATPTSLWGQNLLEETSDNARKRSKLSSVSLLMLSCCTMLTTSYPVQVTVPIRSLLTLIERVLVVDGSLSRATSSYVIATEQEFICSELPVLHSYSLELLTSVIKGMRSQLLPHAAYVVRLVKEYFRRCQLSELRIKIYSITKILLISMGIGIAIYLAQEVVNNSLLDLNPSDDDTSSNANPKALSEAFLQPCHRKRKHGAAVSHEQKFEQISLEVEAPRSRPPTLISVKIAALEAVEALLTVGGALRSESWRSKVDHILITMAEDSCKSGWTTEDRNTFLPSGPTSMRAELQLAIFRALLVSLLSPSLVRPPHLAQSLELFRRGRQETGTKLSEFCSYALLALEVLIHPRALPLVKIPPANSSLEVNHGFPETLYTGSQKHNTPFSSGIREMGFVSPDSDDELYESWLGGSNETDTPMDGKAKNTNSEKHSENLGVQWRENISAVATADVEMQSDGDEIIVKSQQVQESTMQLQELVSSRGAAVPVVTNDCTGTEVELTRVGSKTGALVSTDEEMAPSEADITDKCNESAPIMGTTYKLSSAPKSIAVFAYESDRDSSAESVPDIVDADPDSDCQEI